MNASISVKQRLVGGDKLCGCWISLFSPLAAEITAAAGYDVAMIDLEHGPGSLTEAVAMMQAVESRGVVPLIRAPSTSAVELKRILDIGPDGIMVPNVRSAAEAAEVVRHCRYGPVGDRGAAPGYMRAMDFGGFGASARNGKPYAEFMEQDFLLVVQVESVNALADIDQIADTDGIDMIFIGPADLSSDLGQLGGFDLPEFIGAMSTIESSVREAGKSLGCIPFASWQAKELYASGYQLVLGGADAMLLAAAARADAAALRDAADT